MSSFRYHDWLVRFDAYIGRIPDRQVAPLVDKCSAHGSSETVLALHRVKMFNLPPNSTPYVQQINVGVISALKKRYHLEQMERTVDIPDEDVRDIYKIKILSAMP